MVPVVADPAVDGGDSGPAAALAPGDQPDHIPAARAGLTHKGGAMVASAGILALFSASTDFGSEQKWVVFA